MKSGLMALICCPACQGGLSLTGAVEEREDEIWSATLACERCAAHYPVRAGMPHLYVDDERWRPKAIEADGWVEIHKQQGIYEQNDQSVDLMIPFCLEGTWNYVAKSFDAAVRLLDLAGDELVLDLGAMRGWASKYFAQLGCRVVAIDVVADDQVGLGRAKAVMKHGHTYFDRVIGDGENLPFHDAQFDLVFCSATLHHFSHLDRVLPHVARVLKPGGRFLAINEPCISYLEREETTLASHAADEIVLGINETRPYFTDYEAAVLAAGLEVELAEPVLGYKMDDAALRQWAVDLGAVRPHLSLRRPRELLRRTRHLTVWRLRAWRNTGRLMWPPPVTAERSVIARAILSWYSGDMYLLARRP